MEPNVVHMNFDQIKHHVAAEVRAAIARAGVTHQEVAEAVGMAKATFSRKTSGLTPFTVVDIILIGAYLGIDIAALVAVPAQPAAEMEKIA